MSLVVLQEMGLAFDAWDLDYYTSLFVSDFKRDPTNVELFDIAQSNSEHSRCALVEHELPRPAQPSARCFYSR